MATRTRVIIVEKRLEGPFGSAVLAARIPHEDLPRHANDDGVVEVEFCRPDPEDQQPYEPYDETRARLTIRCLERGFRVLTDQELEDEIDRERAEDGE